MKLYFKLIIGILLMMGGCSLTTEYFSDSKAAELNEKIKVYEKFVASPIEVNAILDSVYTETTMKIMGAPVKLYETKYFFTVDGTPYQGVYRPTSPPSEMFIKIQYLPEDPSVNAVNAKNELTILQNSKESKGLLYFGLALLAIGFFNAFTNFKAIRQRKRDEEEATERSIQEYNRSKGLV